MTVEAITDAILGGAIDGHEDAIRDAMKQRSKAKARQVKRALSPGDKVRIKNTRPKYLNGLIATVEKVNRTRAQVRFDNPEKARRFGYGLVNTPLTQMEPL